VCRLLQYMGFCEVVSLAGDVLCKMEASSEKTIRSLKRELEGITGTPVELQQFIYHDEVVTDDQLCCCDSECSDFSVQLVILSIPCACTTTMEMSDLLCMLTEWGSQALAPHIEDIVSLLGRNSDEDYFHFRVSALKALAHAGDLCSPYCNEIVASMPVFIDECEAAFIMRHILPERTDWTASKYSWTLRRLDYLWSTDSILRPLSSLLSAIGPEGLLVMTDRLAHTFQSFQEAQKEVALVAIVEAMLSFGDFRVQCIDWLAVFICDSNMRLSWCAIQLLNRVMLKSPDLLMAMEQFVPSVLSCFESLVESLEDRFRFEDCFSSYSPAMCSFLGNYSHLIAPHMKNVITVFLAMISEESAGREIEAFQRHVERKPHGAYMFYMKNRDSLVAVFSSIFKRLGYECCERILQEYAELPCHVGPCQKAVLLLAAAQPMPTFTKSQALGCSARVSALLRDVNWQLRMCAIYCLQRLMAGCMGPEPYIHQLAVLLKDRKPFVRQSAATALGCLGRRVALYEKTLLSLLEEDRCSIRYAALVTLGGLMALARRHSRTISRHLHDKSPRCRMAALRVLKNSGLNAAPFLDKLQAWRQKWYDASQYTWIDKMKKLEPITARALMFPSVPLKHLFKGRAPLGRAFAGPKTARIALEKKYNLKMSQAVPQRMRMIRRRHEADDHDVLLGMFASASDIKESREHYRAVQNLYHDRTKNRYRSRKQKMTRWHLKLSEGSDANTLLASSRKPLHSRENKQHTLRVHAETMDEWIVPTVKPSCCNVDALDYEHIFTLFEN